MTTVTDLTNDNPQSVAEGAYTRSLLQKEIIAEQRRLAERVYTLCKEERRMPETLENDDDIERGIALIGFYKQLLRAMAAPSIPY